MRKPSVLLAMVWTAGMTLAIIWLVTAPRTRVQAAPAGVTRYVSTLGADSGDCASSDCRTIQYAINQSSAGDLILVTAGVYTEHILIKDGIAIHGQGWGSTIIDGQYSSNSNSVVTFEPLVGPSTVLSGVQVTRGGVGNLLGLNPLGAGISIVNGSPTIINTWVYSCTGYYGGGIYAGWGAPTLINVPVWNNQALYGGGFYLTDDANVTLTGDFNYTNGTVMFNSATYWGGGFYIGNAEVDISGVRVYSNTAQTGGGLQIEYNPWPVHMTFSDISGNTANFGGGAYIVSSDDVNLLYNFIGNGTLWNNAPSGGGGIVISKSNVNVEGNAIIGNRALSGTGGGFYITSVGEQLKIHKNWILANQANYGGGVYYFSSTLTLLDSNVIGSNYAYDGAGMYALSNDVLNITNNIVVHNTAGGANLNGGFAFDGTPARMVNNTIANNTGTGVRFAKSEGIAMVNNIIHGSSEDGIEHNTDSGATISYTLRHNDVFGNTPNYTNIPGGVMAQNVSVDPQFIGSGNIFDAYHLLPTSPISTTGLTAWAPIKDIDGQTRLLGGTVSIGADEVSGPEYPVFLPLVRR